METESNIPDDASAMSTTPEDKFSLAAQLDGIPNQCETAEAEDKQKGDKTTKIMITSIRTQEDKSSTESSSPDKPSIETVDELSYCQADKIVNQPFKQISENETEYQTEITSKDIEIGGHKIEVINDTNIEEYDLDIEHEEVSNLAWAGEPNLKAHEHESSTDKSGSSHDQHASIEVISDTTEKQTITSQTNENTMPKEKEDADLEYIEQATIISEANLRLINEVLIPNLELETKNLYKDDERVTESGVPEQETLSTVPTLAIVEDGTIEKIIQEQTHKEEESTNIHDDKSYTPENEHEQSAKVLEEIDLLKTTSKVSAENEEHADQKSEAQSSENMTTKHIDSDEMEKTESIQKSSYDIIEQEHTPELPSAENWEINNGGKIITEEATGVPEVQTIQPPPTIESVIAETFDKSIQEEIDKDGKSAVTDTEEGQTHANDFEDKTNVLEAFELHEVNGSTFEENEKNAEPQSEASLNTIALKHPDLQRLESTEINLSNDTEEQENVPPSGTGEQSEIKDGPQIIQEEAKEIGLATEKQLPVTAIESVSEEDAPSIMATATLALVQSGTIEKTIQELSHEEEEPTRIDDEKSCTKENEHDQATKILEAINLPETMSKVSAESVEHADQKSEAQRSEGVITKHVDSEEMVKMENIEKESHDVKEVEESTELPSAEHQEINDGGKIIPEEVLGVPEYKTLQSLPVIASTRVENVDKSIQEEIHKDVELAITDTDEGPRAETEFEERTDVLEVRVDHEETENLQAPDIGEKLEVKDGDKILQGEAKEMEQGTKKQLPEAGIESVPEQETLSTIPKLVTVEVGTVEKTIQEQTHEEKEPTLIDDNKSCTTENEHEKATKVIEAIDLPETMSKESAENEEKADQKSKEQSSDGENWITNHIDLEEIVTTESIEKSSYGVKELKKTLELSSAENQDIDDGGKILLEEAIGVPDGQTLQLLPPLASIGVQNVDRSIQEGIHIDGESALTDTEECKTHEHELEDKTNSLEAFELHEIIANTNMESEKKVEPKSAASLETIVLKHPNLEGLEKTAIKQSNDTEEQENVPDSNTGEKLEIKDGPEIIQEEAREQELATEIQLPETVTECVHEQEALPTVTSLKIVEGGTVEKTIQEQTHEEDEPKLIDDDRSCRSENEHEQATNVLEAIGLPETMSKGSAENEELANNKLEAQSGENVITKHINSEETGTTENIEKSSYDIKDLEKTPELPSAENREINDRGEIIQEEAIGVPEDQTLQPPPTIESVVVQTFDKSIREEIHKDGKSAVTDTEEGQTCENEFEGKTNVLEACDLHKMVASTTEENEKKAKPQPGMSLESTVLKHSNLEGLRITELNMGNDTEELKNFLASDTVEKSGIKDSSQIIEEEAKEMEIATEMATQSVSEQDAPSTMPIPTTVQSGKVEKAIHKHTHEEEESTPIDDNRSSSQDNEHEQATKSLQAIDQPEDMSKASADNEQHGDKKSEAQSMENVNTKHIDLEEVVKMESIEKSSYDVKELKKTTELPSFENREVKITPVEAIGVPADQSLPSLPTIASIGVETVNNSIQEKVQKNSKSALLDTEEEQKQENEFEDKTNVLQAFKMDELITITYEENYKKAEPQSVASIDTIVLMHPDLEVLETAEMNLSNKTEEQENVRASDTGKKLEIKDGPQIIQDEAKEMELATENQLPEPATETIVEGGTVEKTSQEQTCEEEKSKLMDDNKSCSPENEYEQPTKVVEAIDVPKTTSKANAENEENANQKSEEQSIENVIAKNVDSEEMVTLENIEKSSYDVKDVEMTLKLSPAESQEINDCGKILLEEALGVPPDQTLQPLPSIASDEVKIGDKSIQEEIHTHGESTVTDTEEGQTHQNESEDKTKVLQAFDLLDENACTSKENREKAELQSDVNPGNTVLKHWNLEGQNPSIDTDEAKNVSAPDTGEELEIKYDSHITQEEAKGVELATERQLLDAATESVPEQEARSTVPPLAIIEGGTIEKITQEQTHEEEESTPIDDDKSCTQEKENEQASGVLEAIDLFKTMSKASVENEEHADQKSEAQSIENMITKHIDSEEMMTKEKIEVSNYDVHDLDRTAELPSSENEEINDDGTNMLEEAIGVPEDQTLQPLPTTESGIDETVDKSIDEEIHKDGESTVTGTEEEQTHENESVDKTNVLEEFDLHEVVAITSMEIEKKVESQSESRLNTTAIKHTSLEGLETIEINPSIETEEPENVPVSDTGKKLEMKDGANIIQEEESVMELATEKQLPEAPTESVNEQEDLSTPVIVEGGTLEKLIQEQAHEEEESTPIDDNKSNTPENKHEQESIVLEEIDLPKTMSTFSAENEEHADHKSEAQCSKVIAKHTDSGEMVTKECIEKSTYDVKLLDKTHELPSSENREINDSEKITPQEAIGVPDNRSLQSPLSIACGGVETVDKNIQKETHKDNESAVTETEEEHMHENEYEGKTNVLEAFDLHEVGASTSEENEEKSEPKLEVSLDTIVVKHVTDPSLEGLETTEINKSIDTGKPENVPASNTGEKLEIKDGSEIIQEKAKEMELATEKMLPETTTKSVPKQEALSTMATTATPEVGTLAKIIQEQTNEEEESTLEDNDKCYTIKNEHENETKVLEVIDSEHADQKSESQSSVNTITKHIDSEETITTESIETSNDVKELQNTPGVAQDQTLQPLPTIASVGVEIHKDDESAVAISREEKTHENKFEEKMKVLEGFGLHEIIASTSEENENKAEASLNSNVVKHHDLEGLENIEIKQSNDSEESENVLASDIGEKLEIEDGAEIILVEAKNMELTTEKQLPETATESVSQQKAPSTMPTPEIVQGGRVDKIIQEQTREEDESTPIDDEKSCNPENEVHEESNLDNATGNTCTDNEKKSNPQSDEHNLETMVIQQPNLEGLETTEIGSSSDIEECEKFPLIQTGQIFEIKDGGKIILEEEKEMEDATDTQLAKSAEQSVPEDEALSTLPTSEFVKGAMVERSFQGLTLEEEESPMTDNYKSFRPENEIEQTTNVIEANDLSKTMSKVNTENEEHDDHQYEAQSVEKIIFRHTNSERMVTRESSPQAQPSYDVEEQEKTPESYYVMNSALGETTEIKESRVVELQKSEPESVPEDKSLSTFPTIEFEKVPAAHTGEKLEIKEEASVMQFLKSSKESVLEDEAQTMLPTSEFVKGETIEKSFQEETLKEEQSTAIDNDKSCRPENEHEQTTEVLEPGECIRVGNFQAEAQRETSIPGTDLVFLNQIEDVDLADVRNFESGENSATPNKDLSSSTTIDASEGPQRDESKNTLYISSSLIPQEVKKEDKAESFNRVGNENIFDKNDARTNENIEEQTIDYENSLVEVKISLPIEGIVNQAKDHNVENFKATDSIEQRDIMDLSFENDPARKEAAPSDSDKAIESEAIEKLEIQELETDQIGSAKGGEGEDEFEKIRPSSNDNIMIKDSQDSDVKVSQKKPHGILSGVGSKVKHSISKVKKAITGKSSHSKTSSEK